MKEKRIIIGVVLLALATVIHAIAADDIKPVGNDSWYYASAPAADSGSWYNAGEFSLDVGAVYRTQESQGPIEGWAGIGIQSAYWFTKHVGVGVETYLVNDLWGTSDDDVPSVAFPEASLSLRTRLPLGRFALHGFGGGGRNFEWDEYTAHAGAGVEFRVSNGLSLVGEARRTWADSPGDKHDLWQGFIGIRVCKWGK